MTSFLRSATETCNLRPILSFFLWTLQISSFPFRWFKPTVLNKHTHLNLQKKVQKLECVADRSLSVQCRHNLVFFFAKRSWWANLLLNENCSFHVYEMKERNVFGTKRRLKTAQKVFSHWQERKVFRTRNKITKTQHLLESPGITDLSPQKSVTWTSSQGFGQPPFCVKSTESEPGVGSGLWHRQNSMKGFTNWLLWWSIQQKRRKKM